MCVGARFVVSPSVAERKGDKDKAAAAAAVQLASFWVVTRLSGSISVLILQLIHGSCSDNFALLLMLQFGFL